MSFLVLQEPFQLRPMDKWDTWIAFFFAVGLVMGAVAPAIMGGSLVAALVLILCRVHKGINRTWLKKKILSPVGIAIGLTFIWFNITSIFALVPEKSFQVANRTLLVILFSVFIFDYARFLRGFSSKFFIYLVAVFCSWAAIVNLIMFPNFFTLAMGADSFWGLEKIFGFEVFFDYHQWLHIVRFKDDSSILIFILPVLFLLFKQQKSLKSRLILGVGFLVAISLAMMGFEIVPDLANKAPLFALVVAYACLPIHQVISRLSNKVKIALKIILIGGILGGGFLFLEKLPKIADVNAAAPEATFVYPDHHRQIIWSFAYMKAKEAIVMGYGLDGIKRTEGANIKSNTFRQEYIPGHPHNWVLEILADTGIVGLLLSFVSLASLYMLIFSQTKKTTKLKLSKSYTNIAFVATTSFWVVSLVSFSIWSAWWLAAYFIFMAILFAKIEQDIDMALKMPD